MDSTEGKSFGAAFYYLLFLNQTNSIISQGAEKPLICNRHIGKIGHSP